MGINTNKVEDHEKMIKLAESGRTPLAMAILEDEAVRLTAQKNAREYVLACEDEKNEMKPWVWNLLFFVLGILTAISIDPSVDLIANLIKAYNGG